MEDNYYVLYTPHAENEFIGVIAGGSQEQMKDRVAKALSDYYDEQVRDIRLTLPISEDGTRFEAEVTISDEGGGYEWSTYALYPARLYN